MTDKPLNPRESDATARLLIHALGLCSIPGSLRMLAESNSAAIERLSEADRQRVRDAYRAQRDKLTAEDDE